MDQERFSPLQQLFCVMLAWYLDCALSWYVNEVSKYLQFAMEKRMVFFTELFEIAMDVLKWIFKFVFKSFREMKDLCRDWATQAFCQLRLGGQCCSGAACRRKAS